MSTPVVVQGTAVEDFGASPAPYPQHNQAATNAQHQPAQTGCKDCLFGILFYINIAAIIAVAAYYGPSAFSATASYNYNGYIYAVVITGILSLIFSGLGLLVLMACPETILKVSLIFVVVMSGVMAVISFMVGSIVGGIFGLIFFAISVCYARAVWSRIPFAACNMTTAITAIKANFGVTFFAYFFTILSAGWAFIWSIAVAGVFEVVYNCDSDGYCDGPNYGYLFLLFLALFFGQQVLMNCVHVTVAGTVGTWWVAPEENGCCGRAVCNSFIRTMTTSFGSICFGSLLVAILQALKALAQSAQANGEGGIGACIAECIISCLANLLEYFNQWAFVYVGVYGFGYLEAGKNVMTLFKNRGWEAIIADDLIGNALALVSIVVGGVMGSIAIIFTKTTDWFDDVGGNAIAAAFTLGFVVGLIVCSVLLSTVASAVNTVIVMFADAPADLEKNYPPISQKMRTLWGQFYPGSV